MSDHYNNGYNGRLIKLSGRRSIHDHSDCIFKKKDTMGRHGLIQHKLDFTTTKPPLNQDNDGTDEVDNNMSKYAHPIQIPSKNINKTQRSRSLGLLNEDFTTDRDVLSKSLPTPFPQKPFCSDDTSSEEDNTQATYFSTQTSHPWINESWNENETSNLSTHSQSFMNKSDDSSKKYFNQWLIIPVVIVVIAIIASILGNLQSIFYNDNKVIVPSKYNKIKLYNDLSNLGEEYKVNDDTILQLRLGISLILEKQDTNSFMFVYNSESKNFDSVLFNDFVNKVASITSRYLRNDSSTVRHLVVDSSSLAVQDSGELIDKYRADIIENGVMLLMRIDTLPSGLAMALHYYCDEYNPLVKNSAIFSTLDLANCLDQKSSHAHIEKCLTRKWHSVPKENIGPLLTRVVNVVIDVTSVF